MADDTIGSANVSIGADLTRFEQGLARAERQMRMFDAESKGQFKGVEASMRDLTKTIENLGNTVTKGTDKVTSNTLAWQAAGLVVTLGLKELAAHAALGVFSKLFPSSAAVAGLARLAPVLSGVAIAYIPVTLAVTILTEAWAQANAEIEKTKQLLKDVAATNLAIEQYQRFAKAAKEVELSQEDVIKTFRGLEQAAKVQLGGSALEKKLRQYQQIGVFAKNATVEELKNSTSVEERLRAFSKFFLEARSQGERLQALDLGRTFLSEELIERLREAPRLIEDLAKKADGVKSADLISEQHIIRVALLDQRLTKIYKDWDDFTKAGPADKSNWVDIGLNMKDIWAAMAEGALRSAKGVSNAFKGMQAGVGSDIRIITGLINLYERGLEKLGLIDLSGARQEQEDLRKGTEEYRNEVLAIAIAEKAVAAARATNKGAQLGMLSREQTVILAEANAEIAKMGFGLADQARIMTTAQGATKNYGATVERLWFDLNDLATMQRTLRTLEENRAKKEGESLRSLTGAYSQAFAQQKRSVEITESEAATIGQSTIQRQRARLELLLWNAAMKEEGKVTSETAKEIKGLGDRYQEAQERIQAANLTIQTRAVLGRGATQAEEVAAKLIELEERLRQIRQQSGGISSEREAAANRVAILELEEQRMQRVIAVRGIGITVSQRMAQVDRELEIAAIAKLGLSDREIAAIRKNAEEIALGTRTLQERTDAEKISISTIGMSVGAAARFQAIQEKVNKALREGTPLPIEELKKYTIEATRLGNSVQNAALEKLHFDLVFERKAVFLTDEDVQIAQRLRGIYPDIATALGSAEANAIRLTSALKDIKSGAEVALSGFLKDLNNGVKPMEALKNAAKRLMDTFIDMAAKKLVSSAMSSLFGGLGDTSGMVSGATAAQPIVQTMATTIFNAFVAGASQAATILGIQIPAAAATLPPAGVATGVPVVTSGVIAGTALKAGGTAAGLAILGPIALVFAAIAAAASLLGLFGGKKEDVHLKEWKELLEDLEVAKKRAISFVDRTALAGVDTGTVGGALKEFDIGAVNEREQELKEKFPQILALEVALAAERLALLQKFKDDALDVLSTVDPLTDTAQKLKDITEAASELNKVFNTGGLGATGGLDKIEIAKKKAEAIAKLRDDFVDVLTRDFNEASGKGFLNEIGDLLKNLPKVRQDAAVLGVDQSVVTQSFAVQLQAIVDAAGLAGPKFDALIKAFPQLAGLVHEFTEEIKKRTAPELQKDRQTLGDDIFRGAQDQSTLVGRLAVFERGALHAREEEIRKGGELLQLLIIKQEQDKLAIIKDFNKQEQEEAARAREQLISQKTSLVDRLFATQTDTSTLTGKMAAFDRAAMRERQEAIKSGSKNIVLLEKVLAAERLKVLAGLLAAEREVAVQATKERYKTIGGFNDRILRAQIGTADTLQEQLILLDRDQLRERIDVGQKDQALWTALLRAQAAERLALIKDHNDKILEETKQAEEARVNAIKDAGKNIAEYLNSLRVGSESSLAPRDRLAAAQKTFEATFALAQGGNVEALGRITQDAEAFRTAAQGVFASGTGYADVLDQIQSQLMGLPGVAESNDPVTQALSGVTDAVTQVTTALAPLTTIATNTLETQNAISDIAVNTAAMGAMVQGLTNIVVEIKSTNKILEDIKLGNGRNLILPRFSVPRNDNVSEARALRSEVSELRRSLDMLRVENGRQTVGAAVHVREGIDTQTRVIREEGAKERENQTRVSRITADRIKRTG